MRMADIHGTCDDRFEAVRGALAKNLDSGDELGASMVVDIDGDHVVDVWGGFRDEARASPGDEHTITNVWSSTKTVTSLAALMLVDRGELDVDQPVAKYWPEFGANGKQDGLVRHVMSPPPGGPGLASRLPSRSSTTGSRPPPGWRPRRPGGSRAPRPAITRSTTGTSWARSYDGSAASPSSSSSPRRSPGRWARTSRSARRKATGTGSPPWSRRRRCRSTWRRWAWTARRSRRSPARSRSPRTPTRPAGGGAHSA